LDDRSEGDAMTTTETTPGSLDQATADRLSERFATVFRTFEPGDLFAADAFFDLLPPMWRFQLQGPGEVFATQLRSIAQGPSDIDIVRTVPTATGFVTEQVETEHGPGGVVVARRLHLCEVRDGRISAVTTYCNGGWDEALRARHGAEAPMIRP
jgi:hypothetical protein